MSQIHNPAPEGYEELARVLNLALEQAAYHKGHERHACPGERFENQLMMQIQKDHGRGFTLGQARKKIVESQRLPPLAAREELLGAINYLAGAILDIEREGQLRPSRLDSTDEKRQG